MGHLGMRLRMKHLVLGLILPSSMSFYLHQVRIYPIERGMIKSTPHEMYTVKIRDIALGLSGFVSFF